MITRLSLDRFEGKNKSIAVLLTDDGESINLPRALLPPGAKAGDVLTLTLEPTPRKPANWPRRPGTSRRTSRRRIPEGISNCARHGLCSGVSVRRSRGLLGRRVPGPRAGPCRPSRARLRPALLGMVRRGRQPLIIDFLDIGQGDSILIRSPEGKTALVDAGPSRDAAAQLLKRKGITALDIVIVSHHHSDHYGGMDQVIRNFKPKYFMATGSSHTTKSYLKLLQTVKAEGITAVEPTAKPRKIELGSVILTVFPQPPLDPTRRTTTRSASASSTASFRSS